jgi:hypothetical protein
MRDEMYGENPACRMTEQRLFNLAHKRLQIVGYVTDGPLVSC